MNKPGASRNNNGLTTTNIVSGEVHPKPPPVKLIAVPVKNRQGTMQENQMKGGSSIVISTSSNRSGTV